ncbi:sensor histidine kinase [Microcella sp.]|uniref:sensor histidine kinase n=1 Tax=Microcella sp. TaxID=1913979 RepID=UPI0025648578|nr:sensor histidine kinase [Microcella sp.]MBX9472452.1 sensor histidine kinase [Microcella sp.]
MTARRVWSAAVLGMAVLLGVMLVITANDAVDAVLGGAGIALLVAGWFSLGLPRVDDPRGAPVFVAAVAVAVTLMVAASPTLAISQGIAYPIAWVFCSSIRRAVVQNIVISAGVTLGFLVSLGTTPDALLQTAFTMVISLGFSLAMGFWIAHMTELGDRNGRLLAELQGAQSQIEALHREAGATAEREHFARELHDTIAQDLTGLVMLAQRARRELGDSETLRIIEENARATLAETRALVASSAALGDDTTDLASALHRLAERFSRETGVEVTCTVAAELALDRETEVVVLRCVQEALGNARKHARASRIAITVTAPEGDTHRVRVEITDDGIGFDPTTARDGFGLSGMTDRLALVHGTMSVQSSPGAGTTLVAELPAAGVTA